MGHTLNPDFAVAYGVTEALIIDHFYFWINEKAEEGRNYYNGRYWFYDSRNSISKYFLYLSVDKIRRATDHLVEAGVLFKMKRKNETDNRTNTLWYAFTDNFIECLRLRDYKVDKWQTDLATVPNRFGNSANSPKNERGIDSNIEINNKHKENNNIQSISSTEIEKEKNKKEKKSFDELFEECWKLYNRKGAKKVALAQWFRLTIEDREQVKKHIPYYVSTRERVYQKDFERYLRDHVFNDVVYKGGQLIYDPENEGMQDEYRPYEPKIIFWYEEEKKWITLYEPDTNFDGYTSETRPDRATVYYHGIRYQWYRERGAWVSDNDLWLEEHRKQEKNDIPF